VLLGEDNALVAAKLQELLEASFEVVGVTGSGEELEALCERLVPEVIVTDIAMPGEGGLVAARHILAQHPDTRVVLISVIDASPVIGAGFSSGVHGYVVKEDAAEELVPAVEAALQGKEYLSAAGRRALG